jgi:hypothetical protein
MTDTQLAPTDAEVEALGHRMCWRYKHDTGVNHISTFTFNAQTLHDFAREVLAKWGTPTAQGGALDAARLDWLRDNSCDLRCVDSATIQGDGDIHWVVIEHYMAKPQEREIGRAYRDDPRAAIDAARAAQEGK